MDALAEKDRHPTYVSKLENRLRGFKTLLTRALSECFRKPLDVRNTKSSESYEVYSL